MSNNHASFSPELLLNFLTLVSNEIGKKNLPIVLKKSGLPIEWANSEHLENLNKKEAAEIYAGLQQAIRTYYGRGARGILQRIGRKFWEDLLENASFKEKAQAKLLRKLPTTRRYKDALTLLTRLLNTKSDEMSVHTLDLNLLLVDNISPTTYNQAEDEPICHLTQGLIQEAVYWATATDALVEEISCQATGDESCEFKIIFGKQQ